MSLKLIELSFASGGQTLLGPLSVELGHVPCAVVLGPNGAGKSLFLRLCHGLLKPTGGRIEGGMRQAMIFQRPVLLKRSVAANVDFALRLRRLPAGQRRERIAGVLASTGLAERAQQPARLLSGGEQQRLALARAWATRPDLLLMDEPTANLDPAATYAVESLIRRMIAEGTSVVMTTHDLAQAKRMAGEILFLHRGRLMERLNAQSFFAAPATREGQAFLAGELSW